MQRIAIIDTGSNTIRLVVYDVSKPAKSQSRKSAQSQNQNQKQAQKQIVNMKKTAGLSNYVHDGKFTEDGVDKASRTLTQLINCAQNLQCNEIYIFATAVLRNVSNSAQAVQAIEKNIDAPIELLSGNEEAALGFQGAFAGKNVAENTLLIDLGGGSCELTRNTRAIKKCAPAGVACAVATNAASNANTANAANATSVAKATSTANAANVTNIAETAKATSAANAANVLQTTSLKIGCVSAYSRFVTRIFPDKQACANIRAAVKAELATANFNFAEETAAVRTAEVAAKTAAVRSAPERAAVRTAEAPQAFGIGGSVRAIAKIMREVSKTHKTPKTISQEDILNILDLLHADPNSFAHTVVRAVPDRIHSVIPGCLIILEVMQHTGVSHVNICKRGLREGYLLQKLT